MSGRTTRARRAPCSGECANDWPPLVTAGKPHAAAGVRAGLLGTTRRAGGRWSAVSASGRTVTAGGAFNIDLSLQAQNAAGNDVLAAASGYVPFFNNLTAPTFGLGKPDPGAGRSAHPASSASTNPHVIQPGGPKPISNVVSETFTIGG